MAADPRTEEPGALLSVPVHEDGELAATAFALLEAAGALLTAPHPPRPAGVGTARWQPAAANTVYPAILTGPMGERWNRPIQKITLSLKEAAAPVLVVIGNSQIVGGQVTYGEIVRVNVTAAAAVTIDFGEGLPPAAPGGTGQFLYWADVGQVNIDVAVQHG